MVNLTWLARALEDGAGLPTALSEVYAQDPGQFAADLRSLLVLVKIAKGE